jgi:hypothetical protein
LDKVWSNGKYLPLPNEEQYDQDFGHHDDEDLYNMQNRAENTNENWHGGTFPGVFGRILQGTEVMAVEDFRRYDSSFDVLDPDQECESDSDDSEAEVMPSGETYRAGDKRTDIPVGPVGGNVRDFHGRTFREILVRVLKLCVYLSMSCSRRWIFFRSRIGTSSVVATKYSGPPETMFL